MQRRIKSNRRPLKKTADAIKEFLSQPERLVFFFDEGRFGLMPQVGKYWARKATRPLTQVKPGYRNFYIYASVSPCAEETFSLFLPWVNTDMMNLYLEELSNAYSQKRIMVIMDQAGWHKSKDLRVPSNITILPLPAYSPELNPVEKLWQWLRRHVCRNRLFDSEEALQNELINSLRELNNGKLLSLCHCHYLL